MRRTPPEVPDALKPKAILSVAQSGGGYDVVYECGHLVWTAVEPRTDVEPYLHCGKCVTDYIDASRRSRKKGSAA